MTESKWKVKECVNLIPICVKLEHSETGRILNMPTLYDPLSEEVFVLGEIPVLTETGMEAIDAVKNHMKKTRSSIPEIENYVDNAMWGEISRLVGLAKPPAQEQ